MNRPENSYSYVDSPVQKKKRQTHFTGTNHYKKTQQLLIYITKHEGFVEFRSKDQPSKSRTFSRCDIHTTPARAMIMHSTTRLTSASWSRVWKKGITIQPNQPTGHTLMCQFGLTKSKVPRRLSDHWTGYAHEDFSLRHNAEDWYLRR